MNEPYPLPFPLPDFLSPKRRLESLFIFHIGFCWVLGLSAFLLPSTWGVFFTDGSMAHGHRSPSSRFVRYDGENVATVVIRMIGAIFISQALITRAIQKVKDGQFQRRVIVAYAIGMALNLISVVWGHLLGDGTMAGSFFGVLKIIVLCVLTAAYNWFAFFQPPKVFDLMGGNSM